MARTHTRTHARAHTQLGHLRVAQAQSIVQGCTKINLPLADADALRDFLALPAEERFRRQVCVLSVCVLSVCLLSVCVLSVCA